MIIVAGGAAARLQTDRRLLHLDNPATRPSRRSPGHANRGGGDFLHGEAGNDVIYGQTGADTLFGDGQDDHLYGNAGADWI